MSHRKTDLGIPRLQEFAKVVLGFRDKQLAPAASFLLPKCPALTRPAEAADAVFGEPLGGEVPRPADVL